MPRGAGSSASWRLLIGVGVLLGAIGARSCTQYALVYQTLPAMDWLEARPPLDESSTIPPASELAEGFVASAPRLRAWESAVPLAPGFAPPGFVVRGVSGVRDAATLTKESPYISNEAGGSSLRLQVIVFHRSARAAAWADLRAVQLDLAREGTPEGAQRRIAGSEGEDRTWVAAPESDDARSVTRVVGDRGPVAFELVAVVERPGGDRADLAARSAHLARTAADEWTGWLQSSRQGGPARES